MTNLSNKRICVIGAGPAGLMACDVLLDHGIEVHLFEKMPSLGRKFLMAGKSGLNITHSEKLDQFVERYPETAAPFTDIIRSFDPDKICKWVQSLGIDTFVGSSGRVFPTQSKAAPLLRTWIRGMKERGLQVHVRYSWLGWSESDEVLFETPNGQVADKFDGYVYAFGGGSWARLGSDGKWAQSFEHAGQKIVPFRPRNCGFQVSWSDHMKPFFGHPVKTVGLTNSKQTIKGDFIVSRYGVEGSAIYTLSRTLDQEIEAHGKTVLYLDLMPDRSEQNVIDLLKKSRGKKSFSTHLKGQLGLKGVKLSLLYECAEKDDLSNPEKCAARIKNLPLQLIAPQPLDEAISTAGGLSFENLDESLMIKSMPGHFAAGEMLDWEAPTGGYLLTACFATGRWAANGLVKYLS